MCVCVYVWMWLCMYVLKYVVCEVAWVWACVAMMLWPYLGIDTVVSLLITKICTAPPTDVSDDMLTEVKTIPSITRPADTVSMLSRIDPRSEIESSCSSTSPPMLVLACGAEAFLLGQDSDSM